MFLHLSVILFGGRVWQGVGCMAGGMHEGACVVGAGERACRRDSH